MKLVKSKKIVCSILLASIFGVGGLTLSNSTHYNMPVINADEPEVTVVSRESWENKDLSLQYNAKVYSDGSIYIECFNKEHKSTSQTYSFGTIVFCDNYYNENYEMKATAISSGKIEMVHSYADNFHVSDEYIISSTWAGSYNFDVERAFSLTLKPLDNAKGDNGVTAFGHDIEIPEDLSPVIQTSKFDINDDGTVNIFDLMSLKRYLLNV